MAINRLIDAALNRAGEGLRTLEDIARFVLDDARISGELKHLRHDVRSLTSTIWPGDRLIWARDTAGDVGTHLHTATEQSRTDLADVAAAATHRGTEALRSLEEVAKLDHPVVAAGIEANRYRLYDLGASLERRLGTAAVQWRVCLLLTESTCTLPWQDVLTAAIEGGVDCVQVREKRMTDVELIERSRAVIGLCGLAGVPVIVNDRLDIALAAGAAGVHLGQHDLPLPEARAQCGRQLIIGLSTHGPTEAAAAVEVGADYVGIGPIYATSTKPTLIGGGLNRITETIPIIGEMPHLAIGGVGPDNAGEVIAAGARGLAVGSAICSSTDPAAAAAACVASQVVSQP
ncbi:MAG: thiamine phosphate synthase [Phycisphaerales bacterium]|jgi:thiamine-phosphate pyrophosphorylase|nr:thiamine phosphate synthase [Phycisphaerales bacterium]